MKRRSPADWLADQDPAIRTLLAELSTSAGEANEAWSSAVAHRQADPDVALRRLVDLEVVLTAVMRYRISAVLKIAREGANRFNDQLGAE